MKISCINPIVMGQDNFFLRLLFVKALFASSLLQPMNQELLETTPSKSPSPASSVSPSLSTLIPNTPENGNIKEMYEAVEITASRFHQLDCSPKGLLGYKDDRFKISWDFNGNDKSSFKRRFGKYKLSADHAMPYDKGNYTCTLTDSNRTVARKTFCVCINNNDEVQEPPFKGSISEMTFADIGQTVILTCSAFVGSPSCLNPFDYSVQWFKFDDNSDLFLENSEKYQISQDMVETGIFGGHLEIKQVMKFHYGMYKCNITNKFGSLLLNTTLTDEVPAAVLLERRLRAVAIGLCIVVILMLILLCCYEHLKVEMKLCMRRLTCCHMDTDLYEYDVMIINGDNSEDWVLTRLIPALKKRHYTYCHRITHLLGGEDYLKWITFAVEKSRHILVVVTPCLMESEFCISAITNAHETATSTAIVNIVPVVLHRIRPKRDDSSRAVIKILKSYKSKAITVPVSCKGEYYPNGAFRTPEKVTKIMLDSKNLSGRCDDEKTLSFNERLLRLPRNENCALRSRSNSPKGKKIVGGGVGVSGERGGDGKGERRGRGEKGGEGGGKWRKEGGLKKEGGEERGRRGDGKGQVQEDKLMDKYNGSQHGIQVKRTFANDVLDRGTIKVFMKRSRAIYKGDEDLFWKKLNLTLMPPLNPSTDHIIN